jgi:hypothetical protein
MNATSRNFLVGQIINFTDRSGTPRSYFHIAKHCANQSAATREARRLNGIEKGEPTRTCYFTMTADDYAKNPETYNPICKTRNMLNPTAGFIDIPASDFGGCCDVGTERYHCM